MADMVTAQELENAKIDARTIGESVNENKIVTPRYGAPFKSIPMIAEEMQSVIGTIIGGGVPAGIVLDASGKTQQIINNVTKIFFTNNANTDISSDFANFVNAQNDGDTIIVPNGIYKWDGSSGIKLITKRVNIEFRGKIEASPTENHLFEFKPPASDYQIINGADFFNTAPAKFSTGLSVKYVPADLPHEYFISLESTEVLIMRSGFVDPYYKNITVDIIDSTWKLRNPLPLGFTDLSKLKVHLIKKSKQRMWVKGLNIKSTSIPVGQASRYVHCMYMNAVDFIDCSIDQSDFKNHGSMIALTRCLDVTGKGILLDGSNANNGDSYGILNSISSYLTFNNIRSQNDGIAKVSRGYEGRHGYNVTFNNCLLNGIDDHWGIDYIIDDVKMVRGVGMAGGGVTILNSTSQGDLFTQRTDTPYNDGSLIIKNSKAVGRLALFTGNTYEIATDNLTDHKYFNVIDIDVGMRDMTNTASSAVTFKEFNATLPLEKRNKTSEIIIRNATCVSLNNNNPTKLIEYWQQFVGNGTTAEVAPFLGDFDSKVFCKKLTVKDVTASYAAGKTNALLDILIADEVVIDNVEPFNVFSVRARSLTMNDNVQSDTGYTPAITVDSAEINIKGHIQKQGTSAFSLSRVFNTTPKVYAFDSRFYNRDSFVNAFKTYLEASLGCVFVDTTVSTNNALGYRSRNNYIKNLTARYDFTESVVVAANGQTPLYTVSIPAMQKEDIIIAQQNSWLEMIEVRIRKTVNGSFQFYVSNPTSSQITIDAGKAINFIII